MRNREKTEERLIGAVDRVLERDGFPGLGVNAVAQEAGASKVLIYRYFGSFEGLLETWAVKNSYWTRLPRLPENEDVLSVAEDVLTGLIDDLRSDGRKREILRWLLAESSPVGTKVMERIEEAGLSISRQFAERAGTSEEVDAEALLAVVTAGINYLALISDRAPVYNGIPLDGDEGWKRIKRCVMSLVENAARRTGGGKGAGSPA